MYIHIHKSHSCFTLTRVLQIAEKTLIISINLPDPRNISGGFFFWSSIPRQDPELQLLYTEVRRQRTRVAVGSFPKSAGQIP